MRERERDTNVEKSATLFFFLFLFYLAFSRRAKNLVGSFSSTPNVLVAWARVSSALREFAKAPWRRS